ncbi:MAG TPA: class I SAM-dependent methyltransferase [Burkholderiales bacterium]|nr:class I SAM-dependent methyltransferase [Burkholderiales bacterium]
MSADPKGGSRAADFFHGYAHDFNAIYGNDNGALNRLINRLFRQAMRVRYEKTIAGCAPVAGKSVLDVGCGPGHYSVALARAGAATVLGLDFAPGMIEIAKRNAKSAGVAERCRFVQGDFLTYPFEQKFDCTVVMGFMDYMRDADSVVRRVLELTAGRAFFSFPADGGILAWQRKLRYRSRCELFMYNRAQLDALFGKLAPGRHAIEPIGRDFFVTVGA